MFRPHRLLTVLACAASACALSAPAALAAQQGESSGKGVVLSVEHRGVRLVDCGHRVGGVRVSSTRGLKRGDVVTVRRGRARVTGHVRKLSFLARVARSSGDGALLTLGDGSSFKLATGRRHGRGARSAASVTIDLQGLAAGQTLLVTIAVDKQGNVVLTVKVLKGAADVRGGGERGAPDPGDKCGEDEYADEDGWCVADEELGDEVDGTVTALAGDASSLTVEPDDGAAAMTIPVEYPELLEGIEVGDLVAVTLDEDGVAIDVELLDWVDDPGDPGDPGDDEGDE